MSCCFLCEVEGLIGGIRYIGVIDNFNDTKNQGIYWVSGGKDNSGNIFTELTEGAPIGCYKWGVLIVIRSYYNVIVQIYIPISYDREDSFLVYRTSSNSSENFNSWKKVSVFSL